MKPLAEILKRIGRFIADRPIVFGALFLYGYYLLLTLDLFEQPAEKGGFLGFLLQFDSLILLWGVVYALVQMQKFRKERSEGDQQQRDLLHEFQYQQMQLVVLDEISEMLNDRINNPLAVISLSAGSLRDKLTYRDDLARDIEKIESSLKRVQEIMMGIQSYHTKRIFKLSRELLTAEAGEAAATAAEA